MEQKKERIALWMAACLISTALLIDGFETLTTWLGIGIVMSVVIAPCVSFLFWIWLKLLDVPFIASPKKFATFAIMSLVELVPALDAIPLASFGWTIGIVILVVMVRTEDKGGLLGTVSGSTLRIMKTRYGNLRGDFERMNELSPDILSNLRKNSLITKKDIVNEVARSKGLQIQEPDINNMLDLRNKGGIIKTKGPTQEPTQNMKKAA